MPSRNRRWETGWDRDARGRISLGLVAVLIAVAIVIAGLCFLYLWQGNRLSELTAVSEDLRARLDAAEEVNRILGMRIEQAFSMERVAEIARNQLGMGEPTDVRYVQLPKPASN